MKRPTWIKLGEIAEFINGGTPSKKEHKFFTGKIPWITSADITEDSITEPRLFITQDAIENSATKLVPAGTILLVTRTGIGKVAIPQKPICFSQDITGINPDLSRVNPHYLGYFLRSKKKYFEHFQRGATIKGLTREVLSTLPIPLFPLNEQNKVVDVLEKANALKKKRFEAVSLAEELFRATFLDMFGDPIKNSKNWGKRRLGDLISFLTSGSRGWAKYYSELGSKFLRIQNVGKNRLLLDDIAYVTPLPGAETERTRVKAGDVLLSITADLGRTAVIPNDFGEAHINQHLAILRVRGIQPLYLAAFLASEGGQAQIKRLNKEGVKAGLNFDDIRSINVLVPPENKQKDFEHIYNHILGMLEKEKLGFLNSEELFNSLLQSSFQGSDE